MTCLEHLIENTLDSFSKRRPVQEICDRIREDVNLSGSGLTVEQCYEICQFIFYDVLPYSNYYLEDNRY